jgi:hypothetical protein
MPQFKGRYTAKGVGFLHTTYFIKKILEPSIEDLRNTSNGNVEVYGRKTFGCTTYNFCSGLNNRKLKTVNKRVSELDLAEIAKEAVERAGRILKIDDNFFKREEEISWLLNSKKILIDKLPLYDVSIHDTSPHSCGFEVKDEIHNGKVDHFVDHMDSHKGEPWTARLEFSGANTSSFVSRIFENSIAFYSMPGIKKLNNFGKNG